MKYISVLLLVVIFATACLAAVSEPEQLAPASGLEEKKTEKRGIYGFGYGHGGYYGGGHGGFGHGGFGHGGYGHGHYGGGFGYPAFGGHYEVHAPYYGHGHGGFYPYHGYHHGFH